MRTDERREHGFEIGAERCEGLLIGGQVGAEPGCGGGNLPNFVEHIKCGHWGFVARRGFVAEPSRYLDFPPRK
jgi:hypothetical protein